ncbi:hypothetical protein QFZ66_001981 [Streptomyces sp. B4I13]|uniref:hypothetical protein n=1 Tax=Streptomyces sp. B4I13 TaxID=3042271 RepID=UPI00278167E2|nr:hypothetical protein [Streptomyces sp. B4I13]MDQ0958103.1 hypothetical protein [Streptomyces sp. B4I13]
MARTWLSILVELVSGHGVGLWPRPGRILAAARSHSFAQLAEAVDVAFGRWDLAHLHLCTLADGTRISPLDWWEGRLTVPIVQRGGDRPQGLTGCAR